MNGKCPWNLRARAENAVHTIQAVVRSKGRTRLVHESSIRSSGVDKMTTL
jgi:hypothetical protein